MKISNSECFPSYSSLFYNHSTVPTRQSEVTVMQSDDNQPRHDDESNQVEHTNGLYISSYMCAFVLLCMEHQNGSCEVHVQLW